MDIELGARPRTLAVVLTYDADFVQTITIGGDDPINVDTDIFLRIMGGDVPVEWHADVDVTEREAAWNVDKVDVNTVFDNPDLEYVLLCYTSGTTELVWASGKLSK